MSVSKFYENREIFVTGATGSLGKVLLEKLLRSCNARKIYVLIRRKKGMPVEERKRELFRSKIFESVLLKNPEICNKVECIEGNLTEDNLGISSLEMGLITKNVSVVFHLAASVKFNEPLRDSFVNNVESTINLAKVCRQMKNLLVFVHTSTAYAFCNRKEVDEKVYAMSRTCEEFKNIANLENIDSEKITNENVLEGRPNTYTLTKAIAENYLNNFCRDLPVVIVRPSIVGCSWKEPIPGWNDSHSGADHFIAAVLRGIARSILIDEEKICDIIPVDTVINLMMAAAWKKATILHQKEDEIPVYNCTSGSINPLIYRKFLQCLYSHSWNSPSANAFLYPTKIAKKNYYWNSVCIVMQHQFPAMLTDLFQVAVGKKPKMMNVYKKFHKMMNVLEYFRTREWKFCSNNMENLIEAMSSEDKQNFDFDISNLNWDDYLDEYVLGIRRFVLKEDDSTIPQSRKRLLMKYYSILLAQTGLFLGFLYSLTSFSL